MAFNPADVDVHKHLEGANYPASGEELASAAQSNDAPDALIKALRDLSDEKLSGPEEARAALVREKARRGRAELRQLRNSE